MLYRPESEFARSAGEFVREFERRTSKKIDVIDYDSKEGIQKAQVYGIVDHPIFIAIDNTGRLHRTWSGKPMPLISDLAAYVD